MRKRIAILCSDDAHHEYLQVLFQFRFQIVAVVIEKTASQRRRLLQKKRYTDYFYSIYHHWRRKILGLDAYCHRYFTQREILTDSTTELRYPKLEIGMTKAYWTYLTRLSLM